MQDTLGLAAFFDAALAAVAVWANWRVGREEVALRLGAGVLGAAGAVGALGYAGLWVQPELHGLLWMLSASVALPLLAQAASIPVHGFHPWRSQHIRFFALGLLALALFFVHVMGWTLWPQACSSLAILTLLWVAWQQRDAQLLRAAILFLLAVLAYSFKLQIGPILPDDLLHIGLALGLWRLTLWALRK